MSITINLKPIKGASQFTVDVEEGGKVSDLKKKINEAKPDDFAVEGMKLILAGKILTDETPISELGLKPDTFIVVMAASVKPKAAPAPATAPAAPPAEGSPTAAAPTGTPAAIPTGAAPTPPTRPGPLPQCILDLKTNPKWPELARVIATDARVLNRCLPALGPWPDLREAIMQNIQSFVLMCREESGVGHGGPLPVVQQGGGPGGAELMQALQQNPELLQGLVAGLPPEMQQRVRENPAMIAPILEAAMRQGGLGGGGGGGGGGMPVPAELSADENAAVERLMALGFEKAIATQAYFACDKNEELAANFLFDGGGDEPMPGAGN